MLIVDTVEAAGFKHAIEGMRNSHESWDKSDSLYPDNPTAPPILGEKDISLMRRLRDKGTSERKFMRMMVIWCNVTAPLYWWKQMDTYTVGKAQNSSSTTHSIANAPFTEQDFSFESVESYQLKPMLTILNVQRDTYLRTKSERDFRALVQLLPESYNQYRTLMFSYETLYKIYKERKDHKLEEWRQFIDQVLDKIPFGWLITG